MTSIKIKTNSYKSIIKNKQLVEIINGIVSSYPLSFVNLEKLKKEINSLDEPFWIKDNEGKYIFVSDKFASGFNLTPSQIEGKPADKFIPAFRMKFNKALEEFIQESGSVFVVEGFPLSGAPSGENFQVIEIPVLDIEGKLNAIIGVVQKTGNEEHQTSLSNTLQLFSDLLKNYILIDNENRITEASDEFCKTFSITADEIKGKIYNSLFSGIPIIVCGMIEDFIRSGSKTNSINIKIPDLSEKEFNLHFIKGRDHEILLLVRPAPHENHTSAAIDHDYQTYDFIVQNNPAPVFIYDKENLRFLQANENTLKLYGYRKDELLKMDLTDLYAPEDIQTLLEGSDEKEIFSKPHKQKRKDGANIFIKSNRVLINYKNKPAFLNIVHDVTENLQLEKEKQFYKTIFSNTSDLIFITDKDGFIKSVSNSVAEILGFSDRSLIETSFAALLIDEDRGKINSSVFHIDVREKVSFETSLKKAANEFLKIKLTAMPVFNFNNEVESFYLICSSIQEQIKEVIKEIPVEVSRSEIAVSSVPEINFLSGIFHDLLTPINVIIGFVQDLTENMGNLSKEQKEAVEIINNNRENLLELTNQIMDFIQTERGEVKLNNQNVRIIEIVDELKQKIETDENVELAYGKISASLEAVTDKEKMLQCFILLTNLVYEITGQKKLYISTALTDEDHFEICLRDNYNTATQKFSEKIIQILSDQSAKFYITRFHSFTLKYLKNLLNLLQGELKILEESEKADIIFVFPLELKEKTIKEETSDTHEIISEKIQEEAEIIQPEPDKDKKFKIEVETESSGSEELPAGLSNLKCLYIEDQLDSQMLFSMQMKDLKELKFAVSLEQSISLLKNYKFDFIVIDINLQGDYNGLDILKIIKSIPEYERVPVIAVTAYYLPVDKEIYIQAGFDDFISKPLLRENLLNSLERILIHQA